MPALKFFLMVSLCLMAVTAFAQDLPELAFEKYTLDNGLEVILHRDATIPMVSVNLWYHVGSKNEKPGRTGFAHLFEHMMFQGSENHDSDYFLPLQKIGGQVNGSTNKDRTNYWENVPSDQLEVALFLEADRMGNLLPAMTQEKLDNQRDVVKNEKRQSENRPYAKSRQILMEMMYPEGHPYRWSVIGSMDDLSAASKEDVGEFFKLYYAPNNASLCVAGDFDPDRAKEWITRYFGPIEPGRPVDRLSDWIPVLDGPRRAVAEDAVELPRLYMHWHSPGWYKAGDAEFDLLASILSAGKNSRLYKSLVYEQQIAQDVRAGQASRELGGIFSIRATVAPGHTLDEVEGAIDQEIQLLLKKGVKESEVELARTRFEAGFVRGLQRIGGFGGKADRLNRYNVYTGDPGYLEQDLGRYYEASAKTVNEYARRYIGLDNRAVLHIVPQGALAAAGEAPEMDGVPGSVGEIVFQPPAIQRATLSNGLPLYLVEKRDLPLVEVHVKIMSGWSADPADRPGTAALCADMLDEGVKGLDALAIGAAADDLGARLRTNSFFDGSSVSLNVLKSRLEPGLDLLSRVVRQPDFPVEGFARVRKSYEGRQQQESVRPTSQAVKEIQRRIFGEGHPYAQPITGTGTPESLAALTTADLAAFHTAHYHPGNAAVVVVGDMDLAEATAALEKAFRAWESGTTPSTEVPPVPEYTGPRVVVIDRPGAQQTNIVAGYAAMSRNDTDYLAFQVMNTAFGGQFASRINMNLREDKGYTYGVRSRQSSFREGGMFLITAPVETPSTQASISELIMEMEAIRTDRPMTETELTDSRNRLIMGFPQEFQTLGGVAGGLGELLFYDLPLDGWQTFADRVGGLTLEDMQRVVAWGLDPGHVVWVLVGDWGVIGEGLKELDLGEIEVIEPGNS